MVGSSRDDSNINPVTLVPASEAIDDIDTISSVEVVDGAFTVDFPDLSQKEVSVLAQPTTLSLVIGPPRGRTLRPLYSDQLRHCAVPVPFVGFPFFCCTQRISEPQGCGETRDAGSADGQLGKAILVRYITCEIRVNASHSA